MINIRPLQRLRDEAIAPYKYNYEIEQRIGKNNVEMTINRIENDYQTVLVQLNKLAMLKRLEEKETPKKPIIKNVCNEVDGDVDYGVCPNCKYPLEYEFNYCSSCGQKLDWSDEDE